MEKARKKEITVEPILWKYFTSKQGLHPVKLKVTSNRVTKNYPVQFNGEKLFLSNKDWQAILSINVRKDKREVRDCIDSIRVKAKESIEKIVAGGRPFTFERFEKEFFAVESSKGFMNVFQGYLDKMVKEERVGSYRTYQCTFNTFSAFLKYKKIKDLSAYDITVDLLNSFEKFLLDIRETSITTVGIYTRTLRIIYNLCADKDHRLKEIYPFGIRGKYRIHDSMKGSKKGEALTIEQLRSFLSTNPEKGSPEWEAKMYWLFCFYCQGMNFRDMALLKYENIQGQQIKYTRQKTKRTEDQEIIEVPLSDSIREIIVELGNPDKRPSSYVFKIIDGINKDIFHIEATAMQKLKTVNGWLKRLCRKNDLPDVTTYWSRHSYANLLKTAGISVEMIRELLGHSQIRTTEHYLNRFDISNKKEVNQKLLDFIHQKAS